MERLVVTRSDVWAEVEILEWIECNTRVFEKLPDGTEYTMGLKHLYQTHRRTNEILGMKPLR